LYSEIDKYLENWNFSEEVENNILKVFDLAISEEERNKNPYYVKIIKSKFVRLVSLGEIPSTPNNPIEASLNLQKWESIIRVFNNVDYSLMVNKIRYEWGSSWVSFRIAKWISFRTGSSRWEAVKHLEKKHISTWDFIITQKHIYFSSPIKSFKIPFSKIVSFQFYNDWISIQRDNHKSSPDIFQNSDARFLNNLFQVVVKNFW
jgi:hypothetical protein